MRKQKGITLIALVITIVVLIIIGGVSVYVVIGQNGVVNKASEGKKIYSESELKEKLEMAIMDIQIEESKKGNVLTKKAIAENLEGKIEGLIVDDPELIEASYENYIIEINDEFKIEMTVGDKIRPSATHVLSTEEDEVDNVEITINAMTEDSQGVQKIILPDNTQIESTTAKYVANKNGLYKFQIIGNNNSKKTYTVNITNICKTYTGDSILSIVENNEIEDGKVNFIVNGKMSDGTEETKTYKIEMLNYYDDMQYSLDEGQTSKVVKLGDETSQKATLIVKYNKSLTIDSGVTLTANVTTDTINGATGLCCKKGMILYVKEDLINNGVISMTARGTVNQVGENVYLWKNANDSFEYIPQTGASGVGGVKEAFGRSGYSGTGRQTRRRCIRSSIWWRNCFRSRNSRNSVFWRNWRRWLK